MSPEFWLQLFIAGFTVVGAGAGVYVAIRSDILRALFVAGEANQSALFAHRRIDDIQSARIEHANDKIEKLSDEIKGKQ